MASVYIMQLYMHIYEKNFMRMRYVSISHVLAEIVYYGVRLTRCLDSDWSSHEYGLKIQGVYITH